MGKEGAREGIGEGERKKRGERGREREMSKNRNCKKRRGGNRTNAQFMRTPKFRPVRRGGCRPRGLPSCIISRAIRRARNNSAAPYINARTTFDSVIFRRLSVSVTWFFREILRDESFYMYNLLQLFAVLSLIEESFC